MDGQTHSDFFKLYADIKREFSRQYCLHPDAPQNCKEPFSQAHSVQRSLLERLIAEDHHVLMFNPEVNPRLGAAVVRPRKVGTTKATVFGGFCNLHDDKLFKPLESTKFDFDHQQIALLGFRSFSRELYQKEAELRAHSAFVDLVRSKPSNRVDRQLMLMMLEVRKEALLNGRNNVRHAWSRFSDMLTSESFSSLRFFSIVAETPPTYLASAAFLPEWGFDGRSIQKLTTLNDFRGISYSAWEYEGKSATIFCWHEDWDNVCLPFIQSVPIEASDRIQNRILSMAFEHCENVAMRPSWWNSLSSGDQDLLTKRVVSGTSAMERHSESLYDDGLNAFAPTPIKVFTNLKTA